MVTKKEFETVYRKFPPNRFEIFYLKHVSVFSLYRNIWPTIALIIGILIPNAIAIAAHFFSLSHTLIVCCSGIYILLLTTLGIVSFIIWHNRMVRIKYICKSLGITNKEYHELIKKYYYYQNYYPDIKDYIESIAPD